MKKKSEIELKQSIMRCKKKLSDLEPYLNNSLSVSDSIYNKIVIEKAILSHQLKSPKTGLLKKIFKKFFPNKKTAICDYFKSGIN